MEYTLKITYVCGLNIGIYLRLMNKRTTIFKQIILNVLIPVVTALMLLAFLNYQNTRKILVESNDDKNKVISEEIRQILEFQDVALNILDDQLNRKMEQLTEKLVKHYFNDTRGIENANLNRIRTELGMDSLLEDIYIINQDGIVVNTTFKKDLNLNLFNFGEKHKRYLLNILNEGRFVSEGFTIEHLTRRLKKYSYRSTTNKKYIIELGIYSQKADEIIAFISDNLSNLTKQHKSINTVDLFIGADQPFTLNKNTQIKDEHFTILQDVFKNKASRSIEEYDNGKNIHYEFLYSERKNTNLYKESVIIIASDRSREQYLLRMEMLKFAIIFGITIFFLIYLIYKRTRSLTNPIKSLVENVKNISKGDLSIRADVKGNNEITILSENFNAMLDQLLVYYNDLKEAKDKAEESDRLKSAFLANMSHEIRTPMNAILGFSEMLTKPNYTDEDKKEFSSLISSNANNLLNLINDIIDIAKIEAGQIKVNYEITSLNKIFGELNATFQREKLQRGKFKVDLRVKFPTISEFNIITDPLRLKQVLTNLIGNALKFTDSGYIEFGFNIMEDNIIRFYVQDSGIGITPEKQNIIFDRFRQADDSHTRRYGGTGLGLAIVKHLIELLGGTIWVESTQGKGSTFYFTHPYHSSMAMNTESMNIKKIMPINNWQNKIILITEDEENNFKLLKAILAPSKARLIWAKNGKEAVEICKTNPLIDLVLMDLKMPEMTGYEATELIKKFRKKLPIIAQTAYAMADERAKTKEAGFDDFITKPINSDELLNKISIYF